MREESDTDDNQSDDGDPETSPSKSPTTPKSVKSKNSSGIRHPPEAQVDSAEEAEAGAGRGSLWS